MKLKFKLALLALSGGMIVFQFTNCSAFWGDLVGDTIFLSIVD